MADVVGYEELASGWKVPVVRCICGAEVVCWDDYNECEGEHAAFNGFGQELRPPSDWTDYGYDN